MIIYNAIIMTVRWKLGVVMTIRAKLILSYITMVMIPVILILLVMRLVIPMFISSDPDFPKQGSRQFNMGITVHDQNRSRLFAQLSETAHRHPERFTDLHYLAALEEELTKLVLKTWLVVRIGERIFYISPGFSLAYDSELPEFGSYPQNKQITIGEQKFSLSQFDFLSQPEVAGSVFMFSDLTPLNKLSSNFLSLFIAVTVFVVMVTNGLLTFFISRSIINPLYLLKRAAEQISTGDLDFIITYAKRNELGELANAFESMRSQLKDSLEKQEQYEINRKELISGISHDLKTPITAIKGYVEGIMDGVANTPEKLERYLLTIHRKASQLDRLIDELFLFSKLDLDRMPSHFETVDITSFLQDCLDELRFDLKDKKINLIYLPGAVSPIQVTADPEKLRRVMMNIIDNAIKYMGEEERCGQISINLHDRGEKVMVSMTDNGPGIREEDLPFIFDRFYRSDPARGSAVGGSGLGLAIAKLIITEHGGEIWAESQLGQGATICFTLPKACIPG